MAVWRIWQTERRLGVDLGGVRAAMEPAPRPSRRESIDPHRARHAIDAAQRERERLALHVHRWL
jgi:hypothetical protein